MGLFNPGRHHSQLDTENFDEGLSPCFTSPRILIMLEVSAGWLPLALAWLHSPFDCWLILIYVHMEGNHECVLLDVAQQVGKQHTLLFTESHIYSA